jgi:hypothetical protein
LENNKEPVYTPEELEELYQLIFLHPSEEDKAKGTLILFDRLAFKDTPTLRAWLDAELEKAYPYFTKQIDQLIGIKKVLFCDQIELSLLINSRFSRIISWRLKHNI